MVVFLATASVNAAGTQHDKNCNKECCAKCDDKCKEACKGGKCAKAESAKKCDPKKECSAKPAQS